MRSAALLLSALGLATPLAGCGGSSGAAAPATAAGAGPGAAEGALPPAAQVLDAYVAATGGKAAYESLKSRVASGTVSVPSMSQPARFTMYQEAPRKMRLVIELPGVGTEERGTDGQTAWSKSNMTGNRILEGPERAQLLRTGALRAEIEWRQLYTSAETVGVEDVDGHKAYKVALHTPEGTVEHRFYDVGSKLLLRTSTVDKSPMGEVPVDTVTSDYRAEGGILVSHKAVVRAMSMEQVLTLEKIEHNVPIDPQRFQVPADVHAAPAEAPARPSAPDATPPPGGKK
ncbi:MAG TPA: hypothetical protein VKB80_02725 [Kofleriaceae bacterium]|nr:hypothetical protein [Kofleriaceae bacterium]